MSGHSTGKLKIWDHQQGKRLSSLLPKEHMKKNEVKSIAVLSNDQLASAYADGSIRIWNYETGKCKYTVEYEGPSPKNIRGEKQAWFAIMPYHKLMCVNHEGKVHIIDYLNYETILKYSLNDHVDLMILLAVQ